MPNIVLAFENAPVTFTSEAYLNATQIAKHFNKRVQHYLDSDRTQEYIQELTKAANPALTENQLVIVKKGGKVGESGTWLHPKLTIDFARWLSAKFAIWCDMQIEKILHSPTTNDTLSEFLKPITEPIAIRDFEWRRQIICQLIENLKKAQVSTMTIISGEELLAGNRFEK
jgi:hypothetical protein